MLISSLSALKQFSISIEETDFSSQLYLILAKIKPKNWDLNVCDAIIVTIWEKVSMNLGIFLCKRISLYTSSMGLI